MKQIEAILDKEEQKDKDVLKLEPRSLLESNSNTNENELIDTFHVSQNIKSASHRSSTIVDSKYMEGSDHKREDKQIFECSNMESTIHENLKRTFNRSKSLSNYGRISIIENN